MKYASIIAATLMIALPAYSCEIPQSHSLIKDVEAHTALLSNESDGSKVYVVAAGFSGSETIYNIVRVSPKCKHTELVVEWYDGQINKGVRFACASLKIEQDAKQIICNRDYDDVPDAKNVYQLNGNLLHLLSSRYSIPDGSGRRVINYSAGAK